MKINSSDPAYPVVLAPHEGRDGVEQSYERGIPIRLEIAARFAAARGSQHILGLDGGITNEKFTQTVENIAEASLHMADAIIAAYNASEPE